MRDDNNGVSLGDLLRDQIDSDPWNRRENLDSVGAVITFRTGIDVKEANRILTELQRRGIIHYSEAQGYDSSMGGPVWYIP